MHKKIRFMSYCQIEDFVDWVVQNSNHVYFYFQFLNISYFAIVIHIKSLHLQQIHS